jgi:polysaccharide biosynthesis/export protein
MFRILLFASLLLATGVSVAAETAYKLSPGDAVLVSVWREDALQREVRVLPDGSITFPLAGRVEVGGLSAPEVSQRIAVRLKQYLSDPNVTVVITGIDGNRAYVLGKVMKPGPVVMTGPITVLQVLSMAGGLDKFADEGAIKVIRSSGGKQQILAVNYRDLIAGREMTTNFQLRAGDTVIVP